MSILYKIKQNQKELGWSIAFIGFIILIVRGTNLFGYSSSLGNAVINIFVSIIMMGWLLKELLLPDDFQDLVQDLAISFALGVSLIIIPSLFVLALKGTLYLLIVMGAAIYLFLLIMNLGKLLSQRRQRLSRLQANNYSKDDRAGTGKIDPEAIALTVVFITLLSLATYLLFSMAAIWRTYNSWAFLAYIRKYLDIAKLDPSNTINGNLDGRVSLSAWLVVLTYIIKLSHENSVTHYFIYLTPIFALLALASFYSFAKILFKNRKTALFATCIQIVYLASSLLYDSDNIRGPGYALVDSIAEDKYFSVWVITPIALVFAWRFFENRKRTDFALFAMTTTTATLIHPIAFASIGLLLGSYLAISIVWIIFLSIKQIKRRSSYLKSQFQLRSRIYKNIFMNKAMFQAVLLSLLFLMALTPYLYIAKTDFEAGGSKSFNMEEAVEGDDVVIDRLSDRHLVFYTISSYRADVSLLSHPFTIISILLSPLLLIFLRRKAARYLFGCLVIPLLLIFNPWTAPLIGKLIAASQIWRLSWSLPVSLVLGYVVYEYIHLFTSKLGELTWARLPIQLHFSGKPIPNRKIGTPQNYLSSLSIIIFLLLMAPKTREGIAFLEDRKDYYVVPPSEIQVGELLRFSDNIIKNTLTDEITSRTLLGYSSDLNMIRYRAQWPYDPELDEKMDYLFRKANSLDTNILDFFDDHAVDILVLKSGMRIITYLENAPSIARLFYENSDFKVYQIRSELKISDAVAGDIYYVNGDYDNAEAKYKQAALTEPEDPLPILGMGRISLKQGDRQEAIQLFKKALVLSSEDEQIIKIISDELSVAKIYTKNYVMAGENYEGLPPPNEFYNFIDHLATTGQSSPDNQAYIRQSVFIFDKKPTGILFQHAPSQVSFELVIPADGWIQFSPVLAPEVWQFGKGDGVQFKIELETQNKAKYLIYKDYFDPKNIISQRTLITKSIDLEYWSGQTVTMNFSTDCGPNDDCRFDWAGWAEPRILQPVAYNFLDNVSDATIDMINSESGYTEVLTQSINNEERLILYQPPSSRLNYSIVLPDQSTLKFGLGMSPEAWIAENSDGVEYNLYVRDLNISNELQTVYHRLINPSKNPDDRRWFDERVDLSRFGGHSVEIIFEALPGPTGNFDLDWGGWSNPVLLDDTLSGVRD